MFLVLLLLALLVSQIRIDKTPESLQATYAPAPSAFVEIEGMQVHYRDQGKGTPLVLIHGTAASLHTWEGWVAVLQDSFRLISLDLPAFGLTGPHPEKRYGTEDYSRVVEALLQHLHVDTCYMAGNSLGGMVSWYYTLKHPEQVRKLILIDAAGAPPLAKDTTSLAPNNTPRKAPFALRLTSMPVVKDLLPLVTPKILFRMSLKQVYADKSKVTDELVQRYYDMMLRQGNRQAFIDRGQRRSSATYEIPDIRNIDIPVLVMWGEQDTWIPVQHVHRFTEALPQAQVVIYPNAGHVPMEEIPEQSARDAAKFLLNRF